MSATAAMLKERAIVAHATKQRVLGSTVVSRDLPPHHPTYAATHSRHRGPQMQAGAVPAARPPAYELADRRLVSLGSELRQRDVNRVKAATKADAARSRRTMLRELAQADPLDVEPRPQTAPARGPPQFAPEPPTRAEVLARMRREGRSGAAGSTHLMSDAVGSALPSADEMVARRSTAATASDIRAKHRSSKFILAQLGS